MENIICPITKNSCSMPLCNSQVCGYQSTVKISGSVAAPKEEPNIDDNPATYTHFDMLAMVARQTKHMFEENTALREALKELLPLIEEPERLIQECIMDYSEVKFCPIRQGKGNQCRHCFDKAIIERARKLISK